MLLIQGLTPPTSWLAQDRYCLLLGSLGGDRFPIAAVYYLCEAGCCEAGSCAELQPACQSTAYNLLPAAKCRVVFTGITRSD